MSVLKWPLFLLLWAIALLLWAAFVRSSVSNQPMMTTLKALATGPITLLFAVGVATVLAGVAFLRAFDRHSGRFM